MDRGNENISQGTFFPHSLVEADIEFGFIKNKLQLFQIRPFLESIQARSNEYLTNLDKDMSSQLNQKVKLDERP